MDIKYVSQVGNNVRNDCGEACVSMVGDYQDIQVTIEQVEEAMNRHGLTDSPAHLQEACDKLAIKTRMYPYIAMADLEKMVAGGHPVICLVDYYKIPSYAKTSSYTGLHYVVVYEVDGAVWYNDPFYKAGVRISYIEFMDAFRHKALVDNKEIQIVPPIIEEVFNMADQAANIMKRAELKAQLVTKDGGYFLRINKLDYWIPGEKTMISLGYGMTKKDIKWDEATKVSKINPRY